MKKVIVSVLLAVFAAIPTAADSKTSVHALPFGAAANASRLDREAADGKGGWLDMGGNDLHVLPAGKINFCGVPFMIPANRDETDKTCIVLGRKGGPARTTVDVPDGSGAFLYLLHASADSAQTKHLKIGIVRMHYADGSKVAKSVRTKRDVVDWTLGCNCGNAVRAWTKYNDNMQVSLFASKFPIDSAKKLVRVEFESTGEGGCSWMILAAARGADCKLKGIVAPVSVSKKFSAPSPLARPLPATSAGQKPRNVILIIGDGMGEGSVDFTSQYCHGRPNTLRMQQVPVAGHCATVSVLGKTTDSAASATAIATGAKTMNGMVGMRARSDEERKTATALVPFSQRAHEKGLAVGLFTNDKLTGATPAGFYGHVRGRGESAKLAEQASTCGYEILIGSSATAEVFKGVDMAARGYSIAKTFDEFKAAPKNAKVFGSINFYGTEDLIGAGVKETIARLAVHPKGFFLMAECATPDGGNHGNRPDVTVQGVVMTDWMAAAALDFAVARGDTLVIITADHETGRVRTVKGKDGRVQISYSSTNHTEEPVALYAYGPGAELFAGTIDNTDIAKKLSTLLDLSGAPASAGTVDAAGTPSLRSTIAKSRKIVGEDVWNGFKRTKFDFNGRVGWVVEPSVTPTEGRPWTWTMQWAEAYVDRTGVLDLLRKGYHHVTLDLFATRMDDTGVAAAAEFQKFLVTELGFAPKANLVGMSWGGFFSTRYAAAHPENVRKIYYDAPLLNFQKFGHPDPKRIAGWAASAPADGKWENDPRMPVNMAEKIAKAGIPVLILYGGQDQTVPPSENCELFATRYKAAGGNPIINYRSLFGHHPHGLDPNKTAQIVNFFLKD